MNSRLIIKAGWDYPRSYGALIFYCANRVTNLTDGQVVNTITNLGQDTYNGMSTSMFDTYRDQLAPFTPTTWRTRSGAMTAYFLFYGTAVCSTGSNVPYELLNDHERCFGTSVYVTGADTTLFGYGSTAGPGQLCELHLGDQIYFPKYGGGQIGHGSYPLNEWVDIWGVIQTVSGVTTVEVWVNGASRGAKVIPPGTLQTAPSKFVYGGGISATANPPHRSRGLFFSRAAPLPYHIPVQMKHINDCKPFQG